MKQAHRVFFDISYTRTQLGSVGITRTVRRLQEELGKLLTNHVQFTPIAFHSSGYREVKSDEFNAITPTEIQKSFSARLLRWISGGLARRFAFAFFPLPILYFFWAIHSRLTFDALSNNEKSIAFQDGDVLLLCDASWCCHSWNAADLARKKGAAVVLLVYDLIPEKQPEYSSPLATKVFKKWLLNMLKNSDAVICISKSVECDLIEFSQKEEINIPPTSHFRLGCDMPHIEKNGSLRIDILNFFKSSDVFFGMVGTIEPRKNHTLILSIFDELWKGGFDSKLIIMGRPNPASHKIIQSLKNHPEHGSKLLTILDASDAEVAKLYTDCRVLLFPSLAEGFGLPLVEARTRGCLVIASDLQVFVDLSDHGVYIYPKNDKNALKTLIINHAHNNRRRDTPPMQPFTWKDSAEEYRSAIKKTLRIDL